MGCGKIGGEWGKLREKGDKIERSSTEKINAVPGEMIENELFGEKGRKALPFV